MADSASTGSARFEWWRMRLGKKCRAVMLTERDASVAQMDRAVVS
jgi:hypothetical protein